MTQKYKDISEKPNIIFRKVNKVLRDQEMFLETKKKVPNCYAI